MAKFEYSRTPSPKLDSQNHQPKPRNQPDNDLKQTKAQKMMRQGTAIQKKKVSLIRRIENSIIGHEHCFQGPFGTKPIIYADSTASGKALSFVEDYLRNVVLPMYANTHTEASATGFQTTRFREEARNQIRKALRAPQDRYAVLFTGSGSTGAMNKLSQVLGLSPLAAQVLTMRKSAAKPKPNETPVVFITSYEHHSNELLWRESNVDLVVIPSSDTDAIDLSFLRQQLKAFQDRPFRLASFSAASNVTGIRANVRTVTQVLHEFGALAAWDFAAAGPHAIIDMEGCDLDAVYLSTHKFAGGPGTPGLLVARRSLFQNDVPTVPGGGTVFYVQPKAHKYIDDIETREEGGTPAIVESIRAGLVMNLYDSVGAHNIERIEKEMLLRAFAKWEHNPNIAILGGTQRDRVSIVSFLIKAPFGGKDLVLHPNFVVAVLNDLFGIQSRGGCSCAGPYGHHLLDLDEAKSRTIFQEVEQGAEAIRPGWTRIGFSYYMSDETVDYLIEAVDLVARQGYKLLPWYRLDPKTGSWSHCNFRAPTMSLWTDLQSQYETPVKSTHADLTLHMEHAIRILEASVHTPKPSLNDPLKLSGSAEKLRHFLLPEEIVWERESSSTALTDVSSSPEETPEESRHPVIATKVSKRLHVALVRKLIPRFARRSNIRNGS